jgi:hypothetical protein
VATRNGQSRQLSAELLANGSVFEDEGRSVVAQRSAPERTVAKSQVADVRVNTISADEEIGSQNFSAVQNNLDGRTRRSQSRHAATVSNVDIRGELLEETLLQVAPQHGDESVRIVMRVLTGPRSCNRPAEAIEPMNSGDRFLLLLQVRPQAQPLRCIQPLGTELDQKAATL